MKKYKFILSGGGTGGHIYPAISIADNLKRKYRAVDILFVGAIGRMEMTKVPENGYKIIGLWISGIKRKFDLWNLLIPFKLLCSLIKSYKIIKEFKPDFVIGTGGYASGPIVYVASLLKIPTLIQEQNSFPGLTNRILSKKVNLISVAYKNMDKFFPKSKILFTGNPVRLKIQNSLDTIKKNKKELKNKSTVLIIGGSLGSRVINEYVAKNVLYFKKMNVSLIWQCGNYYYDDYKNFKSKNIKVVPFINNIIEAYDSADIIVTRAGASVISELCIIGKPVIFIPSPNLTDDHQTKNADSIVKAGAALMVKEINLEKQFKKVLTLVLKDGVLSKKMSDKIKSLAKPNASLNIIKNINLILNGD